MDWQKELERTLNNVGAGTNDTASLYDSQVSSGQHLGSSLSSLIEYYDHVQGEPRHPEQLRSRRLQIRSLSDPGDARVSITLIRIAFN